MKSFFAAAVTAVVVVGGAQHASASSLTFTFDCRILNTNPATCDPSISVGTLKLTDSAIDPNRVDLELNLVTALLPDAVGIHELYLNYNNAIAVGGNTHLQMELVAQNASSGNHTLAGDTNVIFDSVGPFHTRLDIRLGNVTDFTFLRSLVLFSKQDGSESNLDVEMFNLRDADSLLFAAFDTLPSNDRLRFGASGPDLTADPTATADPVPEPVSLLLVGAGLSGAAMRRKKKKQ
jgi:hypothetical protein